MRESLSPAVIAPHNGGYAALTLGRLYVLIPRGDLRTIEAASDVDRSVPPENGVGWLELDHQRLPVYCAGSDLHPIGMIPDTRRICVVLRGDEGSFGLLCDEVALVAAGKTQVQDLPVAMTMPGAPVVGLAKYADSIACVCTAERLHGHLSRAPGATSASRRADTSLQPREERE
jgi:hypothetical protein